jgi:methyltransferase (TIGR00027 family)
MKRAQASMMAEGIAIARVLEAEKPLDERICDDRLARKLISPFYYWLGKLFAGYSERRGPGMLGFLVARCRYIDDYLEQCLADGIQQVVILGAGLDSRAYRLQQLQGNVHVFEVDHPASQQSKKEKLQRIFGTLPAHVTYVPIDFNEEALDKLFTAGYDRGLKTLFIMEGVVHYLTPQAVDQTLAFVVQNSSPGSVLVFDYLYAELLTADHKRREITRVQRAGRATGEGLTFGIPEGQAVEFLRARGYTQITNVTADDLHQAYFSGVNAKRPVAPVYAIVHATVPEKNGH